MKLTNINLSRAFLPTADLTGTILKGATLTGAKGLAIRCPVGTRAR
ncbi:pentapeptide repeat-containing protein [Streptomyces sp. NPDC127112]